MVILKLSPVKENFGAHRVARGTKSNERLSLQFILDLLGMAPLP